MTYGLLDSADQCNNNNLIGIIMNANKDFNKKDSLNDNQMITI